MITYRPSPALALSVALGVSVLINLWQAKVKWIGDAVAPVKAELDTIKATDEAEDEIAALRTTHEQELAKARQAVAVREGKRQVVYRDRIVRIAAPTCPPGADRVDAWNAIGQESMK